MKMRIMVVNGDGMMLWYLAGSLEVGIESMGEGLQNDDRFSKA